MNYFQRHLSKIKHKRRKDDSGRHVPSKKLSMSSAASSHDPKSTALPRSSQMVPSEDLSRSQSPSSINEITSAVCTRKMTTESVEDEYVRVSQETAKRQPLTLLEDGPSPRTTMYQENIELNSESKAKSSSIHHSVPRSLDKNQSSRLCPDPPDEEKLIAKSGDEIIVNKSTGSRQETLGETPKIDIDTRHEGTESVEKPSRGLLGSQNEWDKLRSLRQDALGLRSSLQRQRALTQIKEDEKGMADGAYMRYLRAHPPVNPAPTSAWRQPTLEKLYEELQQARNEHGPTLMECMKREEALDAVEFEMGRIEDHLYVLLFGNIPNEPTLPSNLPHSDKNLDSPSNPSPWLGLVAGIQDRFEPLQTKYLSRLGDLDLAKERLGNLQEEKNNLLQERESLLLLGRELSDTFKATLEEIPDQETKIRLQIMEIERDVEGIRQECIAAGVEVDDVSDAGSGESISLFGDDVQHDIQPMSEGNT